MGRQAAEEMSLARLPGEVGTPSAACAEDVTAFPVLVSALALVEVGMVLPALVLASAWALVGTATVLPASVLALVLVEVVEVVEEEIPA